MSLLKKLPVILDESNRCYSELLLKSDNTNYKVTEIVNKNRCLSDPANNILASGDNLDFMEFLLKTKNLKGNVNLIYVDPPFFSKSNYNTEIKLDLADGKSIPVIKQKAYHDTWENGMEDYLNMLTLRFLMMKDLLAEDGSLWVHLDWHAVHYVKVLLDEIFGEKNFINEVIWHYKSGGASKRSFARKHDTLLFYAKSKDYYFDPLKEKSYNRGFKPYRFKGVKEYRDEQGWYTMVTRKDVWYLDMVGRTSAERTGYVTQKPETLMERILESCSKEGDLVADFFGGSGTMAAAAYKKNRSWISCDIGKLALIDSYKRLMRLGASFTLYEDTSLEKTENRDGDILVDVTLQSSPISDKMILRLGLEGYSINIPEALPVDPRYLNDINRIMKHDPLQLVSCWSIDLSYQGGVHRPDVCFYRGRDKIETYYETPTAWSGPVSIKVLDIFGNSIHKVFVPEVL